MDGHQPRSRRTWWRPLAPILGSLLVACGTQPVAQPTPSPSEVVLPTPTATPAATASPTSGPTAGPTGPEWRVNLRANHQAFALRLAVALVDMETGRLVARVGPDTITVDFETAVGGRAYWMTEYSVSRGLPNGMAKSEVEASVSAPPPPTPSGPPASLAGAGWTRLPTSRHVVALTFDAGGNSAGVASILATLERQGVPGTFFLTGRWTEVYPGEAGTIAARYPVGNHTYSHPHLPDLGDAQVGAEVARGAEAIRTATGRDPRPLFRFPYGESDARTLAVVHGLGYGGIRWTVDTLGWKGRAGGQSADSVVARVVGALQPGEIVLMHVGGAEDGTTLDADALPRMIAELRARGYAFATVGEFV